MDKEDKEILSTNCRLTCGKRSTLPLDQFFQPDLEKEKERKRKKIQILKRECPTSLQISRRSDRRFPARQEAKLLNTARATRGHRFWGVSTNSGR